MPYAVERPALLAVLAGEDESRPAEQYVTAHAWAVFADSERSAAIRRCRCLSSGSRPLPTSSRSRPGCPQQWGSTPVSPAARLRTGRVRERQRGCRRGDNSRTRSSTTRTGALIQADRCAGPDHSRYLSSAGLDGGWSRRRRCSRVHHWLPAADPAAGWVVVHSAAESTVAPVTSHLRQIRSA